MKLNDLEEMTACIRALREQASRLKEVSDIPAVVRNCERILASTRLLEIEVVEAVELAGVEGTRVDRAG